MKIAFLNLCHCDPQVVARAAKRLLGCENFHMYIHVDAKASEEPFREALSGVPGVFFVQNRQRVYWGGFNAIRATVALLEAALASGEGYDYFVLLQNLDYPVRSNREILAFFEGRAGTEFIRGCPIAKSTDWHYARKYRIYNKRDDDYYLKEHSAPRRYLRYAWLRLASVFTLPFNGVIRDDGHSWPMYYGAAQWAVTRACAEYLVEFFHGHPGFNRVMAHVQFPDEEYFHTIVHNSAFKTKCAKFDEPEERWLVNWRNLHYFEFPKEVTVLTEGHYDQIAAQEDILFIRKVRTGVSDRLMDMLDLAAMEP